MERLNRPARRNRRFSAGHRFAADALACFGGAATIG
jgi:hypothetical protein